jgi:TonB-dependent starch-binding outer membrane protein SusC
MSRSALGLRLTVPASALSAVLVVAGCHNGPNSPKLPATGGGDSVQVGYGTQSRRNVIGAISSIDGDSARKSGTVTSMFDMLEGRVPGLEVRKLSSGALTLRIRGSRSLLAESEPLLVVDGIPMDGGAGMLLADMDPRDVKRIEVLKDAGSLAAYGSRGANGVLLITTKKQ